MKKIIDFIESVYNQLEDIECREEMLISQPHEAIVIGCRLIYFSH